MMFDVGKSYRFVLKKSIPILDSDPISDEVYDSYHNWNQMNGKTVTCISSKSVKTSGGCQYHVKVFLAEEDEDWWFDTNGKHLHPLVDDTESDCSCTLSVLMISGCKCGADI
jgi:hypothetical protein